MGQICMVCNRKFLMMETYVKIIKPCEESDEQVFFVVQSVRTRIDQANQLRMRISELSDQLVELQNLHAREKREIMADKQYKQQQLEQALHNIEYMDDNSKKKRAEL